MNADQKAVIYTVLILIIITSIMVLASPFLINVYFNHVAAISVGEAQNYINSEKEYGKTIVVTGEVIPDVEGGFLIRDQSTEILAFVSGKLNCIPTKQGIYRIAGAWNPGRSTPVFYAVWIVGGCDDLIDNRPSSEKEADILN